MENILNVKKVYRKFENQVIPALNNISLNVKNGEFISIMGSSGSGKTTLLNAVATLDKIDSGEIILNGVNINNLSDKDSANFRKEQLGFIFQEYRLLSTLTVRENIALSLSLIHIRKKQIDNKINKLSNQFKISDQLEKYPYELSGGQKQRVAIVRALIKNPKLILADEPTGALDSNSTKLIMKQLKFINKNYDTTIIMVTHDSLAASYSDKVLFLKDGEIVNAIFNKSKEFINELSYKLSQIESKDSDYID